ncbi:MAG: heme o synthase [Arsenophonus sp.]
MNQYLEVIKPGIIFSNSISVIGGFLLASKGKIDYFLLFSTLLGVSLVVASGCVFNNYIDQDIDQVMERTKNRSLIKRLIDPKFSLIYATILGISGIFLLYITTNPLSVIFAVIGFIIYVCIYSLYMKRKSVYSTLIGSLSGAAPPIIGYCSVSNKFDIVALILLFIFSFWQIPHSYSIAIFHLKDYKIANIPVLPVINGTFVTKIHIFLYILAFMIATIILAISGYTGYKYLIVSVAMNLLWLCMAMYGFKNQKDDSIWARRLFILSILIIISFNVMISIDSTISSEQNPLINLK